MTETGAMPPRNIEAEKGVISSCMRDPQRIDDVMLVVSANDFWLPGHQMLFASIVEMNAANQRPEPLLLGSWLRRKGQLNELATVNDGLSPAVSGRMYIDEISRAAPTAHNAEYYARLVAEAALMRRLELASGVILQIARDETIEPNDRLARCEAEIFKLGQCRGAREPLQIGDVLSEAVAGLKARCEKKLVAGVATRFFDLDTLTGGMRNGEMIVLAGRPGMGKSALAGNIAEHVSLDGSAVTLMASLEMSRAQLGERLILGRKRINSHKARNGHLNADQIESISQAIGELSSAPLWIDDTPGRSVAQIASLCRRHKRRHGLDLLIIDYLQILQAEDRRVPREQQVAAMSQALKNLAREIDRPVLCLAQLNRQTDASNRPVLSHLRESGAVEQEADQVWFVHRDEYYAKPDEVADVKGKADLIVAKNRSGPTGTVKLTWLEQFTRFENHPAGGQNNGF